MFLSSLLGFLWLITLTEVSVAEKPNFFVGIRIRNAEILKQIENVQEKFVAKITDKPTIIKAEPITAHVTLLTVLTTHLKTTETDTRGTLDGAASEAANAKLGAVITFMKRLRRTQGGLKLSFEGIGDFSKDTKNPKYNCKPTLFYAKPDTASDGIIRQIVNPKEYQMDINLRRILQQARMQTRKFDKLRTEFKTVPELFKIVGNSESDEDYVPHLTVMRTSDYKVPPVIPDIPADVVDTKFGTEDVHGIELCYMSKGKDKASYYDCPIELALN